MLSDLVFSDILLGICGAALAFFLATANRKHSTKTAAILSIISSVCILGFDRFLWLRTDQGLLDHGTCLIAPWGKSCPINKNSLLASVARPTPTPNPLGSFNIGNSKRTERIQDRATRPWTAMLSEVLPENAQYTDLMMDNGKYLTKFSPPRDIIQGLWVRNNQYQNTYTCKNSHLFAFYVRSNKLISILIEDGKYKYTSEGEAIETSGNMLFTNKMHDKDQQSYRTIIDNNTFIAEDSSRPDFKAIFRRCI